MTFFVGGIGFYFRKPIAKKGVFYYVFMVVLMGFSGFESFGPEVVYAFIGIIIFMQAIWRIAVVRSRTNSTKTRTYRSTASTETMEPWERTRGSGGHITGHLDSDMRTLATAISISTGAT